MTGDVIELPVRGDPVRFAKAKWAWLDKIAADASISPAAFKMAYLLASRFLSRERGYAYPPQKALAKLLGITDRQVRRLLFQLIDGGYVEVTHCGKKLPNEYRIAMPKTGKVTGRFASSDSGPKTSAPYQPSEHPFEGRRQPARSSATLVESESAPTFDVSRDARHEGASNGRVVRIGSRFDLPQLGWCTVEAVYPVERQARVIFDATGEGCLVGLRPETSVEDIPDDFDEVPF
ncbi:MAG: helix-turn-helix domain-containing protein [Rhizobiaceae bacterium]|nr:helix-turn-helix domain-containing protein [Rhizobiaceae bacterium]MCV0408909.1 helix-turn-helix domain-containing protein [Rhizobiaceae bacterium]